FSLIVDATLLRAAAQSRDDADLTALMRAARDGERGDVKALLDQGVDISAKDSYGWTALTYAAAQGDVSIVKALIAGGADVNARNKDGYTPLMMASVYGRTPVVKELLARGAEVNAQGNNSSTALTVAARGHHKDIVDLLKKAGGIESEPVPPASLAKPNSANDTRPVPLNNPKPSYTTKARDSGIEGTVHVRVLVGADGTVKKVRVLAGLPYGLSYQAMNAAYELRFKPATKDGQ